MKILLVGSSGFLGTYISTSLRQAGYKVIGTTRNREGSASSLFFNLLNISDSRLTIASIMPDVVINCAWITSHGNYASNSINNEYSKAEKMLFEACLDFGVEQYISLGTSMERAVTPMSSQDIEVTLPEANLYSRAKSETCDYINVRATESNLCWNWVRVYQPYGRGQDQKRYLPELISKLKSNSAFKINHPNDFRDWISARDIGKALLLLVKNRSSGIVELGTTIATSNLEIATRICEILNVNVDLLAYSIESRQNYLVAPECNILRAIKWSPDDSLDVGLNWMIGRH